MTITFCLEMFVPANSVKRGPAGNWGAAAPPPPLWCRPWYVISMCVVKSAATIDTLKDVSLINLPNKN